MALSKISLTDFLSDHGSVCNRHSLVAAYASLKLADALSIASNQCPLTLRSEGLVEAWGTPILKTRSGSRCAGRVYASSPASSDQEQATGQLINNDPMLEQPDRRALAHSLPDANVSTSTNSLLTTSLPGSVTSLGYGSSLPQPVLVECFEVEQSMGLSGHVSISGAKNSALVVLAGAICSSQPLVLRHIPDLHDVRRMFQVNFVHFLTHGKDADPLRML